jgi:pyridoxine kinase
MAINKYIIGEMMSDDIKILTIQDISCYGQCSITVALPILSAFGIETAVLPSAILSTHTSSFTDYTFRDLTEDLPSIKRHWEKEGIYFDAIYTGFICSSKQLDYIKDIIDSRLKEDGLVFVDPAMADYGEFYNGFDQEFADNMSELCKIGDYVLPNTTEACCLLHRKWKPEFTKDEMIEMAKELSKFTKRHVILKGDTHKDDKMGMLVFDKKEPSDVKFVYNDKVNHQSFGTGDVFASVFVGSTMIGKDVIESTKIAGEFTKRAIEKTIDDSSHNYGVKFEQVIPELYDLLNSS